MKRRRPYYLTARAVHPMVAGLEELGVRPGPLLRAAGISDDALADPDGVVPSDSVGTLWQHALAATGDPVLGIHIAEAAPLRSFEVHGYALLSSRSLRDAYRRACRYQRLIHEATELSLEEGPDDATLVHGLPGGRPVGRHPAEFLVTAWVRIGRLVVGRPWVPEAVYFGHEAPGSLDEHRRVFGAPVHFRAGRTALRVANEILDLPGTGTDDALARILDRHVASILAERPDRTTLAGRVRELLADGLSAGEVQAARIARKLSMSERSLRRGLAAEGTSHRELLQHLRQERAVALLSERHCSIAEVAFLVGFSELSAFYRAFKRWTGSTPAEVRAAAFGRIGQ